MTTTYLSELLEGEAKDPDTEETLVPVHLVQGVLVQNEHRVDTQEDQVCYLKQPTRFKVELTNYVRYEIHIFRFRDFRKSSRNS